MVQEGSGNPFWRLGAFLGRGSALLREPRPLRPLFLAHTWPSTLPALCLLKPVPVRKKRAVARDPGFGSGYPMPILGLGFFICHVRRLLWRSWDTDI